jgi:hypothetical protein
VRAGNNGTCGHAVTRLDCGFMPGRGIAPAVPLWRARRFNP